jgi:hypothetical protein
MNANGNLATVNAQHTLVGRESPQALTIAARERITDLIRQSTMSIQQALAEVKDIIVKTEAEMEISEEISVVVERDRTVASVKRNFRFAKDK